MRSNKFVRQLIPPMRRLALVHAMTIRAAGDEQSVNTGHAQIMGGHSPRMFRMKAFQTVETRRDEFRNNFIVRFKPGCAITGHAARVMNQGNRSCARPF